MRRLIIRPGAIGDLILTLPAIEALAAGCDAEVWVAAQNVPLVRCGARVRPISETGLDWLGIPDREPPAPVLERLRGFDSIVSWYGTRRPEFRAAVADLPFRFLEAMPSGGVHAADFYLRQATGREGPAVPRIECPREDGGFVAIHPFSGSAKKNWPLERFRELAARLPWPVEWIAGPGQEFEGAVHIPDLYELACRLACARLYIGNDSGITHLAAAVGTPVIAIFGETDPAIWVPRGEQVRVIQRQPLADLTVEAVLKEGRDAFSDRAERTDGHNQFGMALISGVVR
jgi:heptosyltransferase-3